MNPDHDTASHQTGVGNTGRWCAIASELPCAIISFMIVGQVLGSALGGSQGAMIGALLGVFLGLSFGIYSVYITIQRLEKIEQNERKKRTYIPPIEEILEEPEFLRDYSHDE